MYKTKKIYYDNVTGEVLYSASYGNTITPDFEQDYNAIKELNERTKTSISLLVLTDSQFEQDFIECGVNYRVNVETKELEFSYPDPNEHDVEQPYQDPLSEQVTALKEQLDQAQTAIDFLLMGGL